MRQRKATLYKINSLIKININQYFNVAYFKVIIEEGRNKKYERVVYMQGKEICETVFGNIRRFNRAQVMCAYPVDKAEFDKHVREKE